MIKTNVTSKAMLRLLYVDAANARTQRRRLEMNPMKLSRIKRFRAKQQGEAMLHALRCDSALPTLTNHRRPRVSAANRARAAVCPQKECRIVAHNECYAPRRQPRRTAPRALRTSTLPQSTANMCRARTLTSAVSTSAKRRAMK